MSEINRVARVLVVLLLAGLMALFVALAIDMAVPTPKEPWSVETEAQMPTAKQESLEASRTAIRDKLDAHEITQEQADEQIAVIDDEESTIFSSSDPSEADMEAYTRAVSDRGLVVALVGMAFVALLLSAGVVLMQRGIALAEAPLFAGAMLAIYTAAVGATVSTAWIRAVISGAVAIGAASAGLSAFRRPGSTT